MFKVINYFNKMHISIFLLCYNESALLPHVIKHYNKYVPSCNITIYDNESTDNSVEIAKNLGCKIISWSSNNIIDDFKYKNIKNTCWKNIKSGWIIMADMDEFLCITEKELKEERDNGTTILNLKGLNMIGQSQTNDLNDIDLQEIVKYVEYPPESKKLCFLREAINEMNYDCGAHNCAPLGNVKYSNKTYINKHMCYLGLNFYINKMVNRYQRSQKMRQYGFAIHYINDINKITDDYNYQLNNCNYLN